MKREDVIKSLAIPMYGLYYLEDIETFKGLSEAQWDEFLASYNDESQEKIIYALEWAVKFGLPDLEEILPDLPYSHDEAYQYVEKLYQSIEERRS